MQALSFFSLLPIFAPLPTRFSLPQFHSQMSFISTAHETIFDFISTKDKHDNKPIPDTRVPGTGLLQTSYSNFHAPMIGSNRAAKKPFLLQLLASPDPSLHELFELRFGSSRQKP